MQVKVDVRSAAPDDARALAPLFAQLGYPTAAGEIRRRLASIADGNVVLVAILGEEIVGFVVVDIREDTVGERAGTIGGLVVDEASRSRGVGATLLEAAERWIFGRGIAIVRVRSNVVRERAHGFYERHRYARVKTQHTFEKRREA
jgi:GNAT superfamily N-acetyltransferase